MEPRDYVVEELDAVSINSKYSWFYDYLAAFRKGIQTTAQPDLWQW